MKRKHDHSRGGDGHSSDGSGGRPSKIISINSLLGPAVTPAPDRHHVLPPGPSRISKTPTPQPPTALRYHNPSPAHRLDSPTATQSMLFEPTDHSQRITTSFSALLRSSERDGPALSNVDLWESDVPVFSSLQPSSAAAAAPPPPPPQSQPQPQRQPQPRQQQQSTVRPAATNPSAAVTPNPALAPVAQASTTSTLHHNHSPAVPPNPAAPVTDQDGARFNQLQARRYERKTYACERCSKEFFSRSELRHHQRIYDKKPYACDQCDRCFLYPKDLKRHKTTHSGTRPFPCRMCTKTFSRKDNLRRHIQNEHGVANPRMTPDPPDSVVPLARAHQQLSAAAAAAATTNNNQLPSQSSRHDHHNLHYVQDYDREESSDDIGNAVSNTASNTVSNTAVLQVPRHNPSITAQSPCDPPQTSAHAIALALAARIIANEHPIRPTRLASPPAATAAASRPLASSRPSAASKLAASRPPAVSRPPTASRPPTVPAPSISGHSGAPSLPPFAALSISQPTPPLPSFSFPPPATLPSLHSRSRNSSTTHERTGLAPPPPPLRTQPRAFPVEAALPTPLSAPLDMAHSLDTFSEPTSRTRDDPNGPPLHNVNFADLLPSPLDYSHSIDTADAGSTASTAGDDDIARPEEIDQDITGPDPTTTLNDHLPLMCPWRRWKPSIYRKCNGKFRDHAKVIQHLKQSHRLFFHSTCLEKLNTRVELEIHLDQEACCRSCRKSFGTRTGKDKHIDDEHPVYRGLNGFVELNPPPPKLDRAVLWQQLYEASCGDGIVHSPYWGPDHEDAEERARLLYPHSDAVTMKLLEEQAQERQDKLEEIQLKKRDEQMQRDRGLLPLDPQSQNRLQRMHETHRERQRQLVNPGRFGLSSRRVGDVSTAAAAAEQRQPTAVNSSRPSNPLTSPGAQLSTAVAASPRSRETVPTRNPQQQQKTNSRVIMPQELVQQVRDAHNQPKLKAEALAWHSLDPALN